MYVQVVDGQGAEGQSNVMTDRAAHTATDNGGGAGENNAPNYGYIITIVIIVCIVVLGVGLLLCFRKNR